MRLNVAEEIYFECESATWVGRPSLKKYEDSFFEPSTFCTAILTLDAAIRALQSLINAYFSAIRAAATPAKRAGGKSGNGTILRGLLPDLAAPLHAMNLDALRTLEGRFRKMPTRARADIPMRR